MTETLVVGGSGFVGKGIQRYVMKLGIEDDFVFTYCVNSGEINKDLKKIWLNLLLNPQDVKKYSRVIYVAGNSNQNSAEVNPLSDLESNVIMFLNFMNYFRGSLVLMSTQAIYDELEGEVKEDVQYVPMKPYAITKQAVESYARYYLSKGNLSKLWILRSKYIYGKGEKPRRLIPRCAKATQGEGIIINGEGKTVLSLLPVEFVAELLVKFSLELNKNKDGFSEILNVNFPKDVTVMDVVEFLRGIELFERSYIKSGELFLVRFWGNTDKLSTYLTKWNMEFPEIWRDLENYYIKLMEELKHK